MISILVDLVSCSFIRALMLQIGPFAIIQSAMLRAKWHTLVEITRPTDNICMLVCNYFGKSSRIYAFDNNIVGGWDDRFSDLKLLDHFKKV